jgi:DnaK suppressor protein
MSLFDDAERRLTERRKILAYRAGAGVSSDALTRIRLELIAIDDALARIERRSYGKCESCGGAVGRQRLMAMPEERHCLDCNTPAAG